MAQLVLLGTGAALSGTQRENTYLVVQGEQTTIMVDCAGSPTQRLLKAKVSLESIDHLVLTHHHPDHLYGLSILLLDLWLHGRKKVLHIYGLHETLRAARQMMHAFEWEHWRNFGFFPVEFHRVSPKGIQLILVTPEFSVSATTTKHLLPTIALRFVSNASGKAIVYTSDTMVAESIVALACDADVLLHEATTVDEASAGHSSARQAGQQAQRAGVKQLVLVHLPSDGDVKQLHDAAAAEFNGKVIVARDFQRIKF